MLRAAINPGLSLHASARTICSAKNHLKFELHQIGKYTAYLKLQIWGNPGRLEVELSLRAQDELSQAHDHPPDW